MSEQQPIDLRTRFALRAKEAAAALGISERALREVAPGIPRVWLGSLLLYPVKPLEEWLARRAKADQNATDKAVDDIMESLNE